MRGFLLAEYRKIKMSKPIPAFPTQAFSYDGQDNVLQYQEDGMTLRDYFAAKAMQVFITQYKTCGSKGIAKAAYIMADSMLKERETNNG